MPDGAQVERQGGSPVTNEAQKWGFRVERLPSATGGVFVELVKSDGVKAFAAATEGYFVEQLKEKSYANPDNLLLKLSEVYQFDVSGKQVMCYKFGGKPLTDEQLFYIGDALGEIHAQSSGIMPHLASIMLVPPEHSSLFDIHHKSVRNARGFVSGRAFFEDKMIILKELSLPRNQSKPEISTTLPEVLYENARDPFIHEFAHLWASANKEFSIAYESDTRSEQPPSEYAKTKTEDSDGTLHYREDFAETLVAVSDPKKYGHLVGPQHGAAIDRFRAAASQKVFGSDGKKESIAVKTTVSCRQIDPHTLAIPMTEKASQDARKKYGRRIERAIKKYERRIGKNMGLQESSSTYRETVRRNGGEELRIVLGELRSNVETTRGQQWWRRMFPRASVGREQFSFESLTFEQLVETCDRAARKKLEESDKTKKVPGSGVLSRTETDIPIDEGTLRIISLNDPQNTLYIEKIVRQPGGAFLSSGLRIMGNNTSREVRQISANYTYNLILDALQVVMRQTSEGGYAYPYTMIEADNASLRDEMQKMMQFLK